MREPPLPVAIAVPCLTALVLGLIRLATPSVWVDEAATATATTESFGSFVTDQYHWLYYTLIKPWAAVAGTSEWALRFPSVLGAMLACGLLVLLADRLFERWVAVGAGLLLATSPFVVQWSQQARGYTMMLALAILATLLLLWALEAGGRGPWAVYGVALAAVVVWHPVGGLLILPVQLVLAYQRRDRVLPHGLLAAVVVCALALPWAGQIGLRSTGERAAINWLDPPTLVEAASALLDVSGAAGVGVLLGLIGLGVLWLRGDRSNAASLAVWAIAPFALSLLISTIKPIFLDRYLIVAAPAFAILGSVAIVAGARRLRPAFALAVAAATLVGLAGWYRSGTEGNWRGEDWRGAVAAVLERKAPSDAILVSEWSASPAATYYGATVTDVSAADSIWVLRWTEEGRPLGDGERRALGFGDHTMLESLDFGSRLDAQHWVREP